jgi:hypothetical protein
VLPVLLQGKAECRGKEGAVKLQHTSKNQVTALPTVSGTDRILLNEEAFHGMISLERKRTERSQRPFLLMLVDVDGIQASDHSSETLGKLLCALSLSIRETDVNGWYKSG